MSKNIKILAIALSVVAFGLISFAGTYAFLTTSASKTNTIGIGTNTIEVVETYTPPTTIAPNTTITKVPTVKNTGNTEVWVRARILFSDSDAEAFCDALTIDPDNTTKKWIYNSSDGYYYYNAKLAANASTSSLFNQIHIKSTATADQLKPFNVIVIAESTSGLASSYQAAWGLS